MDEIRLEMQVFMDHNDQDEVSLLVGSPDSSIYPFKSSASSDCGASESTEFDFRDIYAVPPVKKEKTFVQFVVDSVMMKDAIAKVTNKIDQF